MQQIVVCGDKSLMLNLYSSYGIFWHIGDEFFP